MSAICTNLRCNAANFPLNSMLTAELPALITVLITAAIDAVNPCAIGVMILMISVLMGSGFKTRRMVLLGSIYIFTIFLTYLLAGLGLTYFFTRIPLWVTEYLSIIVGVLIVIAGLLEVKDYFWYGRWVSLAIPGALSEKIKVFSQRTSVLGVAFLGFFVAAVELPCTGAPYLAIITLLSQYFDATAFALLVLYNFIFVLPLIIILALVAGGMQLARIHAWKQTNRPVMRLFLGYLLIALGWLLILIANGTLNFG